MHAWPRAPDTAAISAAGSVVCLQVLLGPYVGRKLTSVPLTYLRARIRVERESKPPYPRALVTMFSGETFAPLRLL